MVKKWIPAHFIMGIAAMLVVFGLNVSSAEAASLAGKASVVVNYEEQTLAVSGLDRDDREVLVNFPTVTTNREGEVTKVREKEWDVYEIPEMDGSTPTPKVTVDISVLNPAKRNFIIVKSTKYDDAILIDIDPVLSRIKGKYDAETKAVNFQVGEEGLSRDEFQYRTSYGLWKDYSDDVTLGIYEPQGVTLYFRQMPGPAEKVTNPKDSGIKYGSEGKSYLKYNARYTFGGNELKVKVTRLKAAPKVNKTDLDKQAYVLKAGLEYRFGASGNRDWIQVSEPTEVYLSNEIDEIDRYYPGQFEVRCQQVEATERAAYIAPSKVMVYDYPGLRTITVKDASKIENGIVEFLPFNADTEVQELKIKKTVDRTGKVTGVEFENVSSYAYQIVVSTAGEVSEASIPFDTKLKPKNLRAGGKLKLSNAAKVCPEGSYIYVRYASVKATGDWASDYVSLGRLAYTK